jgi:DNA-binding MarR family transcriptional regulator
MDDWLIKNHRTKANGFCRIRIVEMATTDTGSDVGLSAEAHQSLALISHLAHLSRRGSEAALEPLNLRPRHLVALTLLRDRGLATQQALIDGLRLDPSTLVGLLNELERGGLVVRERDPEDRRRHIVRLSELGRERLEQAERALASVQDDVLGALSDDERCTLHSLLLAAAGGKLAGAGCATAAAAETCVAATEITSDARDR